VIPWLPPIIAVLPSQWSSPIASYPMTHRSIHYTTPYREIGMKAGKEGEEEEDEEENEEEEEEEEEKDYPLLPPL